MERLESRIFWTLLWIALVAIGVAVWQIARLGGN